jgi:hypothetical protein
MVVWAHEESYAFGRGLACSRIVAGDFTPADLDEVWNGFRRADAIRKIGGNPERIAEARRDKGSHHCYLELHIEQVERWNGRASRLAWCRASSPSIGTTRP